jgi:hypothetical protein
MVIKFGFSNVYAEVFYRYVRKYVAYPMKVENKYLHPGHPNLRAAFLIRTN